MASGGVNPRLSRVKLKNGVIFRNGHRFDEPYLTESVRHDADRTMTVPPGHLFVMGDNRNNSLDSRRIGSIPFNHCLGNVFGKL